MRHALFLAVLMAGGLASSSATSFANPPSPDAAWLVLDGCAEDPPPDPRAATDFQQFVARMMQCGEAARTIVNAGTEADRERLWSVFDGLGDDSRIAADVLDAFLDRHVERALADLGEPGPRAADAALGADRPLPAFLDHAPVELQQAWRTYQAITRSDPPGREGRPAEDRISFQANEPAFRRAVAGFLRGRVSAVEAARELYRYEWGGWCWTGSDALYGPRSKALVIAHLEGRRPDLALAASGGLGFHMLGRDEQPARWDRRLLAASGIDWERFYVGGVLSGEADLANELGRRGSDRAARQLLAATRLLSVVAERAAAKHAAAEKAAAESVTTEAASAEATATEDEFLPDTDSLLWALAALVEPSGACTDYGTSHSRDVLRDPVAGPIGTEVQEAVLDLLAVNVRPAAGLSEAETASHLLVRLCREESRPAFRAMLRSRYDEVRKRGALGLRAFGETFAEPRPSRPVAFRVVVNGHPAAQQRIQWSLETTEGRETMSGAESDGAGFVRIGRDPFVDPKNPVKSVRLSAPDLANPGDVWFDAGLDAPENLDAVSTVSVRTGSLTVVVPRSLMAVEADRRPVLRLLAEVPRFGEDAFTLPISGDLPVSSARVSFPKLQHGRYQVWLQRGDDLHSSPKVDVGERPAAVTVSDRPLADEMAELAGLPPD